MKFFSSRLRRGISGVEESQFFAAMRSQILSDLRANTNDRSLAGRIDPQIVHLVNYINGTFTQYVTSSSCGGRVSLFHKGISTCVGAASPQTAMGTAESSAPAAAVLVKRRKRGSFGRGILFQSHDPFPTDTSVTARESIIPALEQFWEWRQTQPSEAVLQGSEVLQLRFEPMILHVLCADINAAAELLKCASESGQMNSGIVSCSRGTEANRKVTCCITSPLCVDIPLLTHGRWCISPADFLSDVWVTFLTSILHHVNALFEENSKRRDRFEMELRTRAEREATQQQRYRSGS